MAETEKEGVLQRLLDRMIPRPADFFALLAEQSEDGDRNHQ